MNNNSFKSIDTFYKKNTAEIIDIIIFGSTIRGKKNPKDTDIIIIYKNKINDDKTYGLQKTLEKEGLNPEILQKTYKEIFNEGFLAREAILKEGYSIVNKGLLSRKLGYTSYILFRYDMKDLTKTKKIQFYYSLYGRNKNEGMMQKLGLIKFSESTILCPIEKSEEAREYLQQQNISYTESSILLLSRINLKNI